MVLIHFITVVTDLFEKDKTDFYVAVKNKQWFDFFDQIIKNVGLDEAASLIKHIKDIRISGNKFYIKLGTSFKRDDNLQGFYDPSNKKILIEENTFEISFEGFHNALIK